MLDGVGIGELPDAARTAIGAATRSGNIASAGAARASRRCGALGLGRVAALGEPRARRIAGRRRVGRMAEASAGKDSVTGHWEMMGIVLERPFPIFPDGFPADVIAEFSRRTGRGVLGNKAASGTEIIDELGAEHMRTGSLIVYTSADSVFQIAAHEDVVPVPELYRACEIAYELVGEGLGVGRVIARPFVGAPGSFRRTANRRDYALPPAGETLLDRADGRVRSRWSRSARSTISSPGAASRAPCTRRATTRGWTELDGRWPSRRPRPDLRQSRRLRHAVRASQRRRRLRRQPRAVRRAAVGDLLPALRDDDLLIVTADHGNDPTTPSTDHSREYVPLLVAGTRVRGGVDLGTRRTFADLGQTLAEVFGVGPLAHGTSFLQDSDPSSLTLRTLRSLRRRHRASSILTHP